MTRNQKTLETMRCIDHMPDAANLNVDVVAALLDVKPVTIWRHSSKGLLRPIRFGRSTRWNLGELRQLLADKGRQ